MAASDPKILSIHVSSSLSGTLSAAKLGAALVPEAEVTFFESKMLSGALGWQVEMAARYARGRALRPRMLDGNNPRGLGRGFAGTDKGCWSCSERWGSAV